MDFLPAPPPVSLFHIEMCSLARCYQIPQRFFFLLILATKCFSSCCVKIYFYSQHILRCFFISTNILIPRTFPTSSSPHSTFSSSPATFLFQSLMYLISLIAHNCTKLLLLFFFFRWPSVSLKQNQMPVT